MSKFTSVAAWAKSIGSQAKTLKGQKKAIVLSFDKTPGMAQLTARATATYPRPVRRGNETRTWKTQRERQEAFAANHPLTLSCPPPATCQDVYGRSTEQATVLELQVEGASPHFFALVDGWIITLLEEGDWNRDRYSKSWHRAHGGVWQVSSRTVRIRRVAADGTLETRDQEVSAWRGNYLLNAIVAAGLIERSWSAPLGIRLHAAFDARQVRSLLGWTIWERTLVGEHVDYCAVRRGQTYHAATVKAAIAGLRTKIQAATTRLDRDGKITIETGLKLGFCKAGMRNFADDFGLDENGAYTPQEIEHAIKAHVSPNMSLDELIQPYRAELRTLASAVGFKVEGL